MCLSEHLHPLPTVAPSVGGDFERTSMTIDTGGAAAAAERVAKWTHGYIGTCEHGKVTGACVEELNDDCAKFVGWFILYGRTVRRVTVQELKTHAVTGCEPCRIARQGVSTP